MLHVTAAAISELHEMLTHSLPEEPESGPAGLGIRLVAEESGESETPQVDLTLDRPRGGDEVVEHEGRSVLIIDPSTCELLEDLILDVAQTPDGPRLELRG